MIRNKRKHFLAFFMGVTSPKAFDQRNDSLSEITACDVAPDEPYYVTDNSDVFNEAAFHELQDVIKEVLNTLKPREAEIIRLKFGFYGKEYTLREIGLRFDGITPETVRQVLNKGLRKIKNPARSKRLRGLL